VAGADLSVKLTPRQKLEANYLRSSTHVRGFDDRDGNSGTLSYNYESRRLVATGMIEDVDRDFAMDTAFYNRTGFTSGWAVADVNFYPEAAKRAGVIKIHPFVYAKAGRDRVQRGDERQTMTGVKLHFTRQGYVEATLSRGYEPWLGHRYDNGQVQVLGFAQFLTSFYAFAAFHTGASPYYDPVSPYQGRERGSSLSINWQPNTHITQEIGWDIVDFTNDETSAHAFTAHVVNSKSVYQFNRHLLVRLLEQYDSSRHTLLTDFLGSYELVPGTVIYAGYGSIYARGPFDTGPVEVGREYLTLSRGLFFKASWLHRF
jgi:hypothetical protein